MIIAITVKSRIVSEGLYALLKAELNDTDMILLKGAGSEGCIPDIILTDHHNIYPKMTDQWPNAKLLLIDTGLEQEEIVNLLVSCRLAGVLSTEMEAALIKKALKLVHEGQIWIDNCNLKAILSKAGSLTANGQIKTISTREQQVIDLIVKGFSNKVIAEELFLSEQTIKAHLSKIFKKYNVSSRTQLMSLASTSHR